MVLFLLCFSLGELTFSSFVVDWGIYFASAQEGGALCQFYLLFLEDYVGTCVFSLCLCVGSFVLISNHTVYGGSDFEGRSI